MRSISQICYIALVVTLAACSTTKEPGIKVEFREVKVDVQRPCPVTKPVIPAPLARPLPTDPARLVDLLTGKLIEWAGAGGYGERADAAIATCTAP